MWLAVLFCILLTPCEGIGTEERLDLEQWLLHGSVDGFPSYSEANALLDGWLKEFPDILRKETLGQTFEGRDLNVYVLGKRNGSPQVLISSLIHAREPAGLSALLYSFGKLLDAYHQGSPEAVYLVHGRETYFWPMINPDGYVENEHRSHGSRMQRKNRRTGIGCDGEMTGIDLNRNFDEHFEKGTDPCSESYAGTEPFSENETQAFKHLCMSQNFVTAYNIHSHGHFLTHPYNWGKKPLPQDMQAAFDELASLYGYDADRAGPAISTVGYFTSGESDDWAFSRRQILSMSPEVGHDFWPPVTEVSGIDKRNLPRTRFLAVKAGLTFDASHTLGSDGNSLDVTLFNRGLSASQGDSLLVAMAGPFQDATLKGPSITNLRRVGHSVLAFQLPVLGRRSSWRARLALAQANAGQRSSMTCVMETQADIAQICHCSGPQSLAEASKPAPSSFVSLGVQLAANATSAEHLAQKLCFIASGVNGDAAQRNSFLAK